MTGAELRAYRKRLSWSQSRLAQQWNISDRSISAYELGKRNIPNPKMMEDALIGLLYKTGKLNSENEQIVILSRQAGNIICDASDLEFFRSIKFQVLKINGSLRAVTKPNGVSLARLLLKIEDRNWEVLPRNGNWMDLRRSNLESLPRAITNHQNSVDKTKTSSKYRGVSFMKAKRKWVVYISYLGKSHYLGLYANEIEAARAYDKKALEFYGIFAILNFPEHR